jgi:hypothetical protein
MPPHEEAPLVRPCSASSEIFREGPEGLPVLAASFYCILELGHDGYHRDLSWGVWEVNPEGGAK